MAGAAVFVGRQADEVENFHAARQPLVAFQAAQFGKEADIFQHGQIFVEREALGEITNLGARLLGLLADVETADGDLARVQFEGADEEPQRGGLARAVRADQAVDLAGFHS